VTLFSRAEQAIGVVTVAAEFRCVASTSLAFRTSVPRLYIFSIDVCPPLVPLMSDVIVPLKMLTGNIAISDFPGGPCGYELPMLMHSFRNRRMQL
jgi:hypothetical protein